MLLVKEKLKIDYTREVTDKGYYSILCLFLRGHTSLYLEFTFGTHSCRTWRFICSARDWTQVDQMVVVLSLRPLNVLFCCFSNVTHPLLLILLFLFIIDNLILVLEIFIDIEKQVEKFSISNLKVCVRLIKLLICWEGIPRLD